MILEFFKQISKIPRASFQEEKIADYLVDFASTRNLEVIRDELNNVIIKKPASEDYQEAAPVILQGHTDMVAEKNKDSHHNFETDPLTLIEEDGWLSADNTTLGADDGVAVAYMLAILDDTSLKHPPLECVFTVQEEVGLIGAVELDVSSLKGRRLIGLDSSGEHQTTISSTGGSRAYVTFPIRYEKTYKNRITVKVKGLKGGHSGQDIDQERGNAIKIAGELFYNLLQEYEVALHLIDGGLKENAIPREAELILGVKSDQVQAVLEELKLLEEKLKTVYLISDSGFYLEIAHEQKDTYTLGYDQNNRIANLWYLMPYGYFHKSFVIEGLTLSSCNIGTIRTEENAINIALSIRSPQPYLMNKTRNAIKIACDAFGAEVELTDGYPGWDYDPNSRLRETLLETYKELYNTDMQLEATHGGLELGIFKGKLPDLDIVAFGPIMHDIHTPQERLDIGSFKRTYQLLVNLLENLRN
jgi:dipeptidase D